MGKFKLNITKRQIVTAAWVVGLLVTMAAIGMLAWWLQNRQNAGDFGAFSKSTENILPSAVSEAQKQALAGKPDEAAKTVQDALNQPNVSTGEKQQLLVQQGVAYSNSGQHQQALEAYLAAEQAKSDFTTSHLIGEEYEALGNKAKAIEYYKKALTQLNSQAIDYQNDKTYYEAKVQELGGSL